MRCEREASGNDPERQVDCFRVLNCHVSTSPECGLGKYYMEKYHGDSEEAGERPDPKEYEEPDLNARGMPSAPDPSKTGWDPWHM